MENDDLTFLLTDIEGSVRLWNAYPDAMMQIVARHNEIIETTVEGNNGTVFQDTGDGKWAVFKHPCDAIRAALATQLAIKEEDWRLFDELRVRMGLHRGLTFRRRSDFCGQTINLTARLSALADGVQVLLTDAVLDPCRAEGWDLGAIEFIDLGLHRLRDLPDEVHIYQATHPELEAPIAHELASIELRPELEEPIGNLFGRSDDERQVMDLLRRSPLVTITGAPGIGKTRLGLRAANRLRRQFPGGAVLVETRACDTEQFLLDVGLALGIYQYSTDGLLDAIADSLTTMPTLIVLDGLEGTTEVAGDPLRNLIRLCREARFLVTSIQPVGLDGERLYPLGPLSLRAEVGELAPAIEMLVDIREADGLSTSADELSSIRELCEAVDGVPLAIELVGFRTTTQHPNLVLRSLGQIDTSAPLRLVLGQAIEQLTEPATRLLEALSLFEGSFTQQTVIDVCGLEERQASTLLTELQRNSLLARFQREFGLWFRVLQPIRHFVREHIAPDAEREMLERLAEATTQLVATWTMGVRGRDELFWADLLEGHYSVITQVYEWADRNDRQDLADSIVKDIWDFAHTRMRSEVWIWAEQATSKKRTTAADADLLGVAALGAWRRGDAAEARRLAEAAFEYERENDLSPTIPARLALLDSHSYGTAADAGPADDLTWAFVDLFEASADGHPYWAVNVHVLGAIGLSFLGEGEAARRLADDGLEIGLRANNPSTAAWARFAAATAYESLDEVLADAHADEALRTARKVGNIWVESMVAGLLVTLRRRQAGGRAAAPLLMETLENWDRRGHVAQQWHAIRAAGFALLQEGDPERGIQLITAAEGAPQAMPLLPSEQSEVDAALISATASLEGTPLRRANAAGRVLDLASATSLALEGLGRL